MHRKELIAARAEFLETGLERVMETGWDLAKRTFGRGGVKRIDIDQVDLIGPKGLGTTKDLGNIKSGLQVVEDEDERLRPRPGQHITLALLGITLSGILQALVVGALGGSVAHLLINQSSRVGA